MPHPNPVTAQQLATSTGRDAGQFTAALAKLNQQALFDAARALLVASVWDQTSPINGNPAEQVLASLNPPQGGAIIAIGDGKGVTSVLQPTDPTTGGPIDTEGAQAVAERIADDIAADRARGAALQKLPSELLVPITTEEPTPTPTPSVEELAATVSAQGAQITELHDTIDGLVSFIAEGL